jgi:hypothetical protein
MPTAKNRIMLMGLRPIAAPRLPHASYARVWQAVFQQPAIRTFEMTRLGFLASACILVMGCGTNVDLGGSTPPGRDSGPPKADSAASSCPGAAAPDASAKCNACEDSHSCPALQPNGCYGGYYCKLSRLDCEPLSEACDAGAALDGGHSQ